MQILWQVPLAVATVLAVIVIVAWLVDNGPGQMIDRHRARRSQ